MVFVPYCDNIEFVTFVWSFSRSFVHLFIRSYSRFSELHEMFIHSNKKNRCFKWNMKKTMAWLRITWFVFIKMEPKTEL